MQKNTPHLFLLFFLSLIHSYAQLQSHENLLSQADQLFAKKKYTESYKIYVSLYKEHKKITPQTLLKMAYIKEALGETSEALYFLNTFYENFPDKKVFNKMKEIADKEKLAGYTYSDIEFFSNLYRSYHDEIIFGLLGAVFVYFLAIATNKIFIKGLSNSSPLLFMCFLMGIAYVLNFGDEWINPKKKICIKSQPLVMDAPSAGGNVLTKLPKGTRVRIKSDTDIWYHIAWGEQTGYIRKTNLHL